MTAPALRQIPENDPAADARDAAKPAEPATPTFPRLHTPAPERRRHRRHELIGAQVIVELWDATSGQGTPFGEIIDLSAGGVRVRTGNPAAAPGQTLAIRLRLPRHAGIAPFVVHQGEGIEPTCEWTGHFAILRRVERADGTIDLGGRLIGMEDAARGMLGLYLSIQPLAA